MLLRMAATAMKKPAAGSPTAGLQFFRCWYYASDLPDVSNFSGSSCYFPYLRSTGSVSMRHDIQVISFLNNRSMDVSWMEYMTRLCRVDYHEPIRINELPRQPCHRYAYSATIDTGHVLKWRCMS